MNDQDKNLPAVTFTKREEAAVRMMAALLSYPTSSGRRAYGKLAETALEATDALLEKL